MTSSPPLPCRSWHQPLPMRRILFFHPSHGPCHGALAGSSPAAPEIAATWLMEESKSAAVLTAATPKPPITVVRGIIFLPAPAMESPTDSIFAPTASIFSKVAFVVAACSWSLLSSCSVSMISRWRASYLSCPKSPFSMLLLCLFLRRFQSIELFLCGADGVFEQLLLL